MSKNISIIFMRKLSLAGRIQKITRTLAKHDNINIRLIDGSVTQSDNVFNKKNISYEWYGVRSSNFRIINLLRSIGFNIQAGKKIANDTDVVICHDLTSLYAGYIAKKRNPLIKLIYDCNELAVERFKGIKKVVYTKILKICLPLCDIILHANKQRQNYFVNKHDLPISRNYTIYNFPAIDYSFFQKKQVKEIVKIIYLGAIIPNRYHKELIECFNYLPKKYHLDIIGFGKNSMVSDLKKSIKRKNLNILSAVPNNKIPGLLRKYHIGLIFYRPVNLNNYYCAPNKIYEYLLNGLCVVSNDLPALAEIIVQRKVGVCIDKVESSYLKKAIEEIVDNNYFANLSSDLNIKYNWEKQESLLQELVL